MKKRRIVLIILGLLCVLAIGAGLAAPSIAEKQIETRLKSTLERRKLDASWQSLKVQYNGTVTIGGFKATDPKRGITVSVEHLLVDPAVWDTIKQSPRLERLTVKGVRLDVDLLQLRNSLKDKPPEQPKTKKAASSGLMSKLRKSLVERPPKVELENMQAKVVYGKLPFVEGKTSKANLESTKGVWTIDAKGEAKPLHPAVPKLLRKVRSWHVTGKVDTPNRGIDVRVASNQKDTPLFALTIPLAIHAEVGAIELKTKLKGSKPETLSVGLERTFTRLGSKANPIVISSLKRGHADVLKAKPSILLEGASLEVNPSRLKELRKLRGKIMPSFSSMANALQDRIKGKDPKTPNSNKKAKPTKALGQLKQLQPLIQRGLNMLWKIEAQAKETSFVVHIEREKEPTQKITLAQGLMFDARDGTITAKGQSAGGTFDGVMEFIPGELLPHMARFDAKHVDIGKLPGMSSGRTLPNRGIRGRLGGQVDLSMVWMAPLEKQEDVFAEYTLDLAANWKNGELDLNGVADAPLKGIELSTVASARWRPNINTLEILHGKAHYGPLTAHFSGSLVDWPLRPVLRGKTWLEKTKCQTIFRALPDAMLGPYRNVLLAGQISPKVEFKYPLGDPWRFKWTWTGLAENDEKLEVRERSANTKKWYCEVRHLRALPEGRPVVTTKSGQRILANDVEWMNKPFIKRIEEGVSAKAEIDVGPGTSTYVPYNEMPVYVPGAAFLSEEILFFSNRGVNIALITKAIRINLERGRFVYGGSTVTQQLVKNLFLTRKKTLARKLQEALVAFRIDEAVDKFRVIELYMNVIEFGHDLYGIGPAAEFYFQRKASQLTPIQAVFLAIIKPSPKMGNRFKRRGTTPANEGNYFAKRMEVIFSRLVERKMITQAQMDAARPFVLKWNSEGKYIEPQKAPTSQPLELLPVTP